MPADPIPAIVESEATGETAVLFAELRAALQVPFVNLVWRHLATIPGGLGWTWSLLKPVYASSALDDAAQALRDGIALRCEAFEPFLCDTVGLGPAEREAIRAVIIDYNHANSMNLLALSVARRVLRQGHRGTAGGRAPARPRTPGDRPSLPRLLGLDELPPALRSLVTAFDRLGRVAPNPAIASLYRHLGHWPAFLALAYTALQPLDRDGSLWAEQERLTLRSQALVDSHLEPLLQDVPPLPPGAEGDHILKGVESVITGRMTVMGTALLALLPGR